MTAATHAMTTAAFKSAVSSIKTRGANITRDIHRAAVAALIFSGNETINGDKNATPALQLAQALAAGLPRNKVIGWLHHFSNVRITVSKAKDGSFSWTVKNLGPSHPEYQEITMDLLQEAIDKPYWDLNPDHDIKEFDVTAAINALLKRANDASKAGKLKADPANEQRLAALRSLVPAKG